MEKRKKFLFLAAVFSVLALFCVTFMSTLSTPVYAVLTRSVTPETSSEFYCKTIDDTGEHYLKYDASGEKLVVTNTPSEAIFDITFVTESTVTITYGIYNFGYVANGGGTELKNASSVWTLESGILKNSTGNRRLLFQISNSTGRCYAHNVNASYNAIYFYSNIQYAEAESRCSWTTERRNQLTNLTYNIGNRHTVSFNANGGTGTMPDTYILDGTSYSVPTTSGFTAPRYMTFDGWSLTSNGSKITEPITVTEDIILYARWVEAEFIVAYILPENYESKTDVAFDIVYDFITIHVTKGSIVPADNQIRIFSGSTITISSSDNNRKIRRIEFVCTANGTTKYGPGCFGAVEGYSYSGKNGVWDGEAASISFTASTNQVRATQIIITCNNL